MGDGYVDGTTGNDRIDTNYKGDKQGDRIDANDQTLPGAGRDDDFVRASAGNDTVRAGNGDDQVYGGTGSDQLFGETGNDRLFGEAGNDTLFGGDGADDLSGGAGRDAVFGGTGNDTLSGGDDADTLYGEDGNDFLHGDAGDDSLLGADGDDSLYGDGGDDTLNGGDGDDLIVGGVGDDSSDGGSGADTIFGDSGTGSPETVEVRESFEWSKAPSPRQPGSPVRDGDLLNGGFAQNTGNVDVTFSVLNARNDTTAFATNAQDVQAISDDDQPVNSRSSLASNLVDIRGSKATYRLDFSSDVQDVSFRINDIDLKSGAVVRAYDADGRQIPITVEFGNGVTGADLDGVGGRETLISDGRDTEDTNPLHSALVNIPGPVSRVEIDHIDLGTSASASGNSGINVSDVYYDVTVANTGAGGDDRVNGGDGADLIYGGGGTDTVFGGNDNDTISGGSGDDLVDGGSGDDNLSGDGGNDRITGGAGNDAAFGGDGNDNVYGGAGDDTLQGGLGDDRLYGGNDRDTFIVGPAVEGGRDTIDGGEGGDDFDRLDLTGTGPHRINYSVLNRENGTVDFLQPGGTVSSTLTFANIETVVCFTPGTLIATPKGEVPVEALRPGDRVITRDDGIQAICWTGRKAMDWATLTANPHLRPILIRRGSLGHGLPERDMMVSPNHRMLVANDRTSLYFDEHEVLVAAKHLVGAKGIAEVESIGTAYIHFMFDRHQVVLADGTWTESFQPGDHSLNGLGNAQRSEIYELFPDLRTVSGLESYQAARRTLKKHEARLLVG